MKKLWALLAAVALLVTLPAPAALAAGSASVSISGYTKAQQGKTYTYTVTVKITSSMDFIGTIRFSGIFSHDPIYLDYHPSTNSSTTLVKKVSFKIPSGAEIGSSGAISVTGQGDYLDASGNPVEYNVSKSITVSVVAPAVSTPKPTSPATPKPSQRPTVKPSPRPSPRPSTKPSTKPTHVPSHTATPTPKASPSPKQWDTALSNAASMQAGGTIDVNAVDNSKMPFPLLGTLREKQGKLTVSMAGCTCVIDGKALGSVPESGEIDLAMTTAKDASLSAAAGSADLYQLHFAGSGQLPGRFIYTFKATLSKPGDTLYLYYYYEKPGVLEGLQSAMVGSDGNVAFEIYHFSSYIVSAGIIPGAVGSLAGQPKETAVAEAAHTDVDSLKRQLSGERENVSRMESLLKEAQGNAANLEDRLKNAESNAAAMQARAEDTLSIPYIVLAAGAITLILLTAVFTLMIFHAGPFRIRKQRKEKAHPAV